MKRNKRLTEGAGNKITRRVLWTWDSDCSPSDKILHIAGFCRPIMRDNKV